MAKPNNGTTTSFESILLNNKNVNTHPQLSENLDAYLLAIAGGYVPAVNVIDAILDLNPTSAAAQASLLALQQQLQASGLTVAIAGGDSASFSIDENTAAVATVVATDPQGDPLTFSLGGADAFLFNVDNNGHLSFKTAPNFEAPADVGGDNIYNVTVQALDSTSGQTDTQAISVTVANVNEAPVAQNDTASGDEDTPITTGNVLSNDGDVDDTLTAASITGHSQGANGAVVDNNDGTFTYTPNLDFNGADSFTYTVSDGSLSSTATVNLTVNAVDDGPAALPEHNYLVVAYINNDGMPGFDTSSNDQLIAGIFDANNNDVIGYGDTIQSIYSQANDYIDDISGATLDGGYGQQATLYQSFGESSVVTHAFANEGQVDRYLHIDDITGQIDDWTVARGIEVDYFL